MTKRVALITWSGLLEGAASEQLLLPHLAAAGLDAQLVDWRSPDFDFSRFDLLILRTCWDYHLRITEFTAWLERAARQGAILNPASTVLWNHNKFYLRELQAQGVQVAPTVFVEGRQPMQAEDRERIRNWRKVVVKPAVSATAHNTWLAEGTSIPAESDLKRKMRGAPFLVQEYMPEIQQGEISFIYIDGHYSHAVLKRPAAGDFRVQKDFGGSAEPFHPAHDLLAQADELAQIQQVRDSLYCRIDALEKNGTLVLMELELIEPELFLGRAEGSAVRFAKAILARVP